MSENVLRIQNESGRLEKVEKVIEKNFEILKRDISGVSLAPCPLLASQTSLAKRYDVSKSTICRILQSGVRAGKVHPLRIGYGERTSNLKYKISEVDDFVFQNQGLLN